METTPNSESSFDYSMQGFEIAQELADFDRKCEESRVRNDEYETQLTSFAERSLAYLNEGLERFPHDFSLEIEAESLARSLSGPRKRNFAVRFNEVLYASISDPARPVDAIRSWSHLQQAIDLTAVADRINDSNFYENPNRVRELGDAIVGRVVLTMLSFNVDPRTLRVPVRS